MAPSGGRTGDGLSRRHVDDDTSEQWEEDGQWEDYTCQDSFEELIRSIELVIREWRACDTGQLRRV